MAKPDLITLQAGMHHRPNAAGLPPRAAGVLAIEPDARQVETLQATIRRHVDGELTLVDSQASENVSTAEERDRRRFFRRSAEEVSWIVDAKLNGGRAGDSAEIVDISSGGSLVQTEARLTPGSTTTLVLFGAENSIRARGKVIRSKVGSISTNGKLSYRAVIQFNQEIQVEADGVDPRRSTVTTPQEEVQPKANERRADLRVKGPYEGGWYGASGRQAAVRITDISESGCFVESMATPPPGEQIRLTLVLPEPGETRITGEVVTVDPNMGFAIRFVELTAHQRAALRQTVQDWFARNCSLTPTTVAATEPNADAACEDEIAIVQVRNHW